MSSAKFLGTMDEWMREQERRTRSLERRKRGLSGGSGGATTITVSDTATIDMVLTGSSSTGYGLSANVLAVPVSLLTGPGTIPPALLPTPAVPALGVTDTATIDMTLTGAGTTASPWNVKGDVIAVPVSLLTGPGTIPPALLPAATSGRIPGEIIAYGGTSSPSGWMLCNGSAVSRTSYPDLFAAIGTNYGVGDGSTTFNLPNLQGKVAVGVGAGYTLGDTGGAATVTLAYSQIPSHTHPVNGAPLSTGIAITQTAAADGAVANRYHMANGAAAISAQPQTGTIGQSHENMPPYQVFRYIIKT